MNWKSPLAVLQSRETRSACRTNTADTRDLSEKEKGGERVRKREGERVRRTDRERDKRNAAETRSLLHLRPVRYVFCKRASSCNHFTKMCSGSETGSYLTLIDSCITLHMAQGPSRTCNESKEEEVYASKLPGTAFLFCGFPRSPRS